MRIISHLVPNGQPISTDIEGNRQPGATVWEIPTWGRPLALGAYPVFLRKPHSLIPAGTSFCISKFGSSITSMLSIREAARRYLHKDIHPETESHPEAPDSAMAVLHHRTGARDRFTESLVDLSFTAVVGSTDICYVLPQFRSGFPYLPLPLSFAIPRLDSRVVCVGFSNPPTELLFSLDDIESGRASLLDTYRHRLVAIEGHVSHIFTRRFAREFVSGPCFTIDTEMIDGMYGGPVFSENGYVCGVLSANASDRFKKPASIVSLLHPMLGMHIRLGARVGQVRLRSDRSLIELIQQGVVMTDGSEKLVPMGRENGEILPDPAFRNEDATRIFDNFAGFQSIKGQ